MTETRRHLIGIRDLVRLRRPATLTVSPDGTEIAFTVAETDLGKSEQRQQVHLAPDPDPRPGKERSTLILTRGFDDAHDPAWSPDGRVLAFITFRPQPTEDEDDDHRDDGSDKQQVFVLPRRGGEARRLTDASEGVEAFRWLPDGSGVLALCVESIPPAERGWKRRRRDNYDDALVVFGEIPRLAIWEFPLDGDPKRLMGGLRGVESFELAPDGKTLAIATNHTGRPEDYEKVEVVLHDLEKGTSRRLTRGRGGSETRVRFTSDGRFVLLHGWADPAVSFSRQELFAVDVQDEHAEPRSLAAAFDRDVEDFVPLADGRVATLVAWGLESRLAVVDPASGAARLVPLEGRALDGLAAGGPRVALVVEDGASPPEVAFVDLETGALEVLTDLNPECESWIRARRQRVRWHNEGFDHEGLLVLPPAEAAPTRGLPPVLVWIHGGPHWRPVDHLGLYEAEAFAAAGWAVLVPQYRGSSGHDQSYSLAIRGDLGGGDGRDVVAALDHVAQAGLVDGTRAAVGGASYGGYLTNWLLATTDRFRAGISVAGIFDLAQDFGTSDFFTWEVHYLGGAPWEKPELYREKSVLTHVTGIRAPLLLLHGLEDDNTYLTNAKALYRALVTLGRTVEFVAYPREGHGIFEPLHQVDQHLRTLAWINQHVRGVPSVHVSGRELEADHVRLVPLGHHVEKDYGGQRPPEGRIYLEVHLLLQSAEGGPTALVLVPAGAGSDIALVDRHGDLYRPIGVPVDLHGQTTLYRTANGVLEAVEEEDGPRASLAVAVVFELPEERATYNVAVANLPPYLVDVEPPEPEDDDDGPEGERDGEGRGGVRSHASSK